MPKPKRRPPVVKTDWVVEEYREGSCVLALSVESAEAVNAWIRISKIADKDRGTKTIYKAFKRTWRKVDL